MKFQNAEEVREHLWWMFNLKEKSITFHVIDLADDGKRYVGGGIVDCSGDLYEGDRFFDIGYDREEDAEIEVDSVESFMIGEGEVDHAGIEDAEILEDIINDSPSAFSDFLDKYADCLVSITDFTVENPAHDGEGDVYYV